jgi:hypothetical protein
MNLELTRSTSNCQPSIPEDDEQPEQLTPDAFAFAWRDEISSGNTVVVTAAVLDSAWPFETAERGCALSTTGGFSGTIRAEARVEFEKTTSKCARSYSGTSCGSTTLKSIEVVPGPMLH